VANPRGYDAVFHFMVYDEPGEQWILSKSEIYGLNTAIVRDQFGKPLSVTQSDASVSATRSYVYDANARLCKTIEPAVVHTYGGAFAKGGHHCIFNCPEHSGDAPVLHLTVLAVSFAIAATSLMCEFVIPSR
jgi:hypothetical protein